MFKLEESTLNFHWIYMCNLVCKHVTCLYDDITL